MAARKKATKLPREGYEAPPDAAFLAAIRAAPDDDAPRLVYADHLLESSDESERLRGEFIVAQCEVARLPRNGPEWRRAITRDYHLRRAVVDELTKAGAIEWERGFPSVVRGSPKGIERTWKKLVDQPIRQITLVASRPVRPTLAELAWLKGTFPQVEAIRFSNNEANGVFDATSFGELSLDDKTPAWTDGSLPHASIREHATRLDLDDDTLDGRRIDLASYAQQGWSKLRELSLRSSDAEAMFTIANRPLKKLSWTLHGAASPRFVTLAAFSTLEELDANERLDVGLAEAIASSSLTHLSLHRDATPDGLAAFDPPPCLRQLALLFAGGQERETRYRLVRGDFPNLEKLVLRRFELDASFARLSFPKLTEVELTECAFDANIEAELRKLWPAMVVR